MSDDPEGRRDAAVRALVDRDVDRAGDLYALAGRGTLAGLACEGWDRDLLGEDAGWATYGLGYLFLSALCARVGGDEDRARRRAAEGIAVATDYRDAVVEDPFLRACFDEVRGDLGVVGGGDADGYDRALERYERSQAGDPVDYSTRPAFEGARGAVQQAARNTPAEFAWDDLHGGDHGVDFLAHRVRFKRVRVPRIVEAVVAAGRIAPPRGTTEHGNATFRCPECGGSEVNWTAGETLCLDCDVWMDRS